MNVPDRRLDTGRTIPQEYYRPVLSQCGHVCKGCGAFVYERGTHDTWHAQTETDDDDR